MSLPAISKHLRVLENAGPARAAPGRTRPPLPPRARRRCGPPSDWIAHYSEFWEERLDALETVPGGIRRTQEEETTWQADATDQASSSASRARSGPRGRGSSGRGRSPKLMMRWFVEADGEMSVCQIDLREGGHYRLEGAVGGRKWAIWGTYLEVRPPERLVYTWSWENDHGFGEPDRRHAGHRGVPRARRGDRARRHARTLRQRAGARGARRRVGSAAWTARAARRANEEGGHDETHDEKLGTALGSWRCSPPRPSRGPATTPAEWDRMKSLVGAWKGTAEGKPGLGHLHPRLQRHEPDGDAGRRPRHEA